jgi:hypothetical protein
MIEFGIYFLVIEDILSNKNAEYLTFYTLILLLSLPYSGHFRNSLRG